MGTIDFSTQKETVRPITMSTHIMKTLKTRGRSLPPHRSQWKPPEKPRRFLRSELDWDWAGEVHGPSGHGAGEGRQPEAVNMVTHTHNPSSWEAETGQSWVLGQPGLQDESPSPTAPCLPPPPLPPTHIWKLKLRFGPFLMCHWVGLLLLTPLLVPGIHALAASLIFSAFQGLRALNPSPQALGERHIHTLLLITLLLKGC